MKIPEVQSSENTCQRIKKSIWQQNGQSIKNESTAQFLVQRGILSQRTLKVDKTRIFRPSNTLYRMQTRSQNSCQENQAPQDENKKNLSKENSLKQTQKNKGNKENIICVIGQLESYEKIKINSSTKIFNTNSQRYDIEIEDSEQQQKKIIKSQENINQQLNRVPLQEINSNCNKTSQYQQIKPIQSNNILSNLMDASMVKIEEEDLQDENEDDKNERILQEKFNQKNKTLESSLNTSIASTNLSSSTNSLVQNLGSNINKKQMSIQNTEKNENVESSFKKSPLISQFQLNDYLDGYKVYKKGEKLFTFKIFKEDFLKIPNQFSKVITHSQDDDVSSDEDVVKGGIKFNYKSILKEIYTEAQYLNAPQLVLSNKLFA
ncbi:hypothetical protein TTHERM_00757770 (macronuclear) [Tetrahymena thermophila SB210]|uniref:Uncharacterized protein n=1 Tax=Tetrahymena thermophila (strain SB210) TaxID=312017 RepID=Q23JM9_TETTS|nr:hypothetical protein TTHERM_00757770 [Tetrahymena thermophila SB210]EAR96714.1 hypothetical protein TTHERM_00757770 [Tetrahymena thermophila SB210]|eukprot:XP_001016959.1 hypothetical protein TTHERM_00757770 [Tetrahymena thermophila SB210]